MFLFLNHKLGAPHTSFNRIKILIQGSFDALICIVKNWASLGKQKKRESRETKEGITGKRKEIQRTANDKQYK